MTAAPPPEPQGPAGTPSPGPPQGWGPPPGWQQQPPAQGSWGGPGQWTPPGRPASDDTTWALLAHLSFFVLGIVAPLVIYLVKKDTSPFVRAHAAEALNFHITVTLAMVASVVLMIVVIGFFTFFAVLVAGAVYSVIAAVAANRGQPFRYPLTLRLVR